MAFTPRPPRILGCCSPGDPRDPAAPLDESRVVACMSTASGERAFELLDNGDVRFMEVHLGADRRFSDPVSDLLISLCSEIARLKRELESFRTRLP